MFKVPGLNQNKNKNLDIDFKCVKPLMFGAVPWQTLHFLLTLHWHRIIHKSRSFSFRFALAAPAAITEIFWVLIILHMTLWRHSVPELKGLYTHYISNRTALWVRGLLMGHSRCWRAGFLRRKMLTPSLPLAIPLSPPPSLNRYRINLKFLNLKLKVMFKWQVTYLSRCQSLS